MPSSNQFVKIGKEVVVVIKYIIKILILIIVFVITLTIKVR